MTKYFSFLSTSRKILCVNIAFLSILHLQSLHVSAVPHNPVCRSTECREVANIYLQNMNKNGNPCTDFYDYVCHGWEAQNPRPNFEQLWKVGELLEQKALSIVQRLLQDDKNSLSPQVEQAKMIYKACTKLPYISYVNPSTMKFIMSKVGNWPMFFYNTQKLPADLSWWQIDNEYIKRTAESALFDITLVGDTRRNNHVITEIKQIESPYGMVKRKANWDSSKGQRVHYKNFLNKVISAVAVHNPAEFKIIISKDLEDVMKFRDHIKALALTVQVELPQILTIEQVQQWYDKLSQSHDTAKINWLEVIRNVHKGSKDPLNQLIQKTTMIKVHKNYLGKLAGLLAKTPKRVIINHIHLYFAERHLIHTPDMISDLLKSYNAKVSETDEYIRYLIPRTQSCIENHSMKRMIRSMYVRAVMNDKKIAEVRKLFVEAKSLVKKEIEGSPWLDKNTKARSVETIRSTTSSIGYPTWFEGVKTSGEQDNEDVDPLINHAYRMPLKNRIYISATFLQPPNFEQNLPYVVDYGSTVYTFAHELHHAFDEDDIDYDKDGNAHELPKATRNEFQKRRKCYKDQYNAYRRAALKRHQLSTWTTLPSTTNEDIADAIGLKAAYKGYKEELKKKRNVCPVLPGFERFGCDKLFFIAFANTFCEASSRLGIKSLLLYDEHSLSRIRVNGAVGNLKDFSDVFGCKPNDPLNLKNRCDLWEK